MQGTGRARCEVTDEMLSLIDVMVDGEFIQEQKNISLRFRGSENQRVIDVKKSLEEGEAKLAMEPAGGQVERDGELLGKI